VDLTPTWFLVIFGAALLINRHFVVRLTAGVFGALGLLLAYGPAGPAVHHFLEGAWGLVT
jgi:hypothetical protein